MTASWRLSLSCQKRSWVVRTNKTPGDGIEAIVRKAKRSYVSSQLADDAAPSAVDLDADAVAGHLTDVVPEAMPVRQVSNKMDRPGAASRALREMAATRQPLEFLEERPVEVALVRTRRFDANVRDQLQQSFPPCFLHKRLLSRALLGFCYGITWFPCMVTGFIGIGSFSAVPFQVFIELLSQPQSQRAEKYIAMSACHSILLYASVIFESQIAIQQ